MKKKAKLNAALTSLTRKSLIIEGEEISINSFSELRDRVKVLLDGFSNDDIGRKGLFTSGVGLTRFEEPNPDLPQTNNILLLDFNKPIP